MFYGWWLVGIAFLVQMVGTGTVLYSYSVVAVALGKAFGASRMTMMLGMTVMTLGTGLISPLLGHAIDRGSLRRMMLLGAGALAAGYCLLSVTTATWQVPVIYGLLMSLASNLLGPLCSSTLLARWFSQHRGLALGIAAVGTSAGGFVFPPFVQWLIDSLGWRVAFRVLGLGTLLLTVPAALLVVNRPIDRGLHPDGAAASASAGQAPPLLSTKEVLRHGSFWWLALVMSVFFGVYTAILSNLAPFALDRGTSHEEAALLISVVALAGIVGKLAFGAIADRIDLRLALAVAALLIVAGLAGYRTGGSYFVLIVSSVVLGLAAGGMLPVWGALLAVLFGAMNYGRVMGLMNPVLMPLTLTGPPLAGFVFDRTGSYDAAFVGFIAALLLVMFLLPAIRLRAAAIAPLTA
jgi:MFS family permease